MPTGTKMEVPLARTEPISNGGSTSATNVFKNGGKSCCTTVCIVRLCERNNSADTKVSEEGGEGGALDARAEISLQPVEKTMVRQAVPLQPMEVNSGADIHLQPTEDPMPEQMDVPKGGCDPVESPWCYVSNRDNA